MGTPTKRRSRAGSPLAAVFRRLTTGPFSLYINAMTESRAGSAGRRRITGITAAALFAALIAGGAFVSVPLPFSPVPVVLQNLFAVLAGLVLGPAGGAAAAASCA